MKEEQPSQENAVLQLIGMEQFFLPYYLFTSEGTLCYANAAAKKYCQLSEESLQNKSVFELFPEIDTERWQQALYRLSISDTANVGLPKDILAGITEVEESSYIQLTITSQNARIASRSKQKKQKSDLLLNKEAIEKVAMGLSESFSKELGTYDGRDVLLGGTVAEESMIQIETKDFELYRRIARSLPKGGLLVFDRNLNYAVAEGNILKEAGYTKSQIEGRHVNEVHDEVSARRLKRVYAMALNGETVSFEYLSQNKRLYFLNVGPKYNSAGEIDGGLLTAFDVQDKGAAEKKLEKQIEQFKNTEALYRVLARSLSGGIFILYDKEIRYLMIEGSGMEALGLKKENVEGKLLKELSPLKYAEAQHYYRQALDGKTISFEKKDEDTGVWFHWTFQPFYDESHAIQGGMIIGSNINKLKEAEERYNATIKELKEANNQLKIENGVRQLIQKNLQEQTRELELKNQELEQFAYVASHDLQEPLRMVSSYTQLLQSRYKDKLDEGAEEFINYAIEGATRMQNLINDLLYYSRVGRKEMSFEKINMGIVLQLVMRNLALLIEETQAEIVFDHLPFINADASQMVQLFQNLISNAIKFRKKEVSSRIEINYTETDKFFVISVKDNGIGMSMEYKDRIFQIFQRLHTRDKYPGTGIGLAICKKIVERHGGEIWIDSTLGEGTTFFFTMLKQ